MIPEFIGRFPITCIINPLDLEAMTKVLTEPKNALIKQYQVFFQMENANLEFTKEALKEIAKKALIKKTGARALRSIIEELLLETMFDLSSSKKKRTYCITPEMVRGTQQIKPVYNEVAITSKRA